MKLQCHKAKSPNHLRIIRYLKAYLHVLGEKDGLYMLVSPRWRCCPGEYLLVPYGFRFCMQPANIRQDTSAIWENLRISGGEGGGVQDLEMGSWKYDM